METADGPVRFRIHAGAAHSWSTLIVESEPGALFVYRMPTGELELIDRADAERLIAGRFYRPWLGATEWTALGELPVVGVGRHPHVPGRASPTEAAQEQPAE